MAKWAPYHNELRRATFTSKLGLRTFVLFEALDDGSPDITEVRNLPTMSKDTQLDQLEVMTGPSVDLEVIASHQATILDSLDDLKILSVTVAM